MIPALRLRRAAVPWLALLPMVLVVLVAYAGGLLWTLRVSLTSSHSFPVSDYVGLAQYARLWESDRWRDSLWHLAGFTVVFMMGALLLGTLLAVLLDRRIRAESLWRTVFLYPYALSLVATGLVWQWLFDPAYGLPVDWLGNPHRVLWPILIASIWQAAGLVMAIVLAGLRGVDARLWQAARIDGIPVLRTYRSIVLPTLGPQFATAALLLATMSVKLFDVVIAMSQGGPGLASEVPTKFIMDHLFSRANLGLASAAAVVLLALAVVVLLPFAMLRRRWQRAVG